MKNIKQKNYKFQDELGKKKKKEVGMAEWLKTSDILKSQKYQDSDSQL